ncbi:MAG TPA: DUF2092 domain-containing protein [Polyangia bacterium]|nr:DUF2092 domain-containing protein [Polyangia bacterium]
MTRRKRWAVIGGAAAVLGVASLAVARQQETAPGAVPPAAGGKAAAAPRVDPKANELLKRMSDYLSGLQTFSFVAEHATEVVLQSGEKLEFLADSNVMVQRPNHLRSDRRGEKANVSLYYDGKSVTIYGHRMNMYAMAAAPPTLDAAIDFTRKQLNVEAPAADLLYAAPYPILMEDVVSGTYVGEAVVDGAKCHHLAFRGNETDWQVWIEDGARPLPRRYVIVSKKVVGTPEFQVELRAWNLSPQVTPEMFVFRPPPGSERIDFVGAAKAARQAR